MRCQRPSEIQATSIGVGVRRKATQGLLYPRGGSQGIDAGTEIQHLFRAQAQQLQLAGVQAAVGGARVSFLKVGFHESFSQWAVDSDGSAVPRGLLHCHHRARNANRPVMTGRAMPADANRTRSDARMSEESGLASPSPMR